MMKNIAMILFLLIVLIVGGGVTYVHTQQSETAFIYTNEVYSGFGLTKSLDQKYKDAESARMKVLDSLRAQLTDLQFRIKSGENEDKLIKQYEVLRQRYYMKSEEISALNEQLSQEYNNKIWEHLNKYVKEYGEENNYDYIYGANGQGSLMYANAKNDITEQVTKYVNKRYAE